MSLMGRTADATLRMFPSDTVDAPQIPAGLANSRLIDLMELAAARLMRAQLRPGESSVAVSTNLRHAALSQARGDTLRASATCQAVEGRLHRFEVNAFDENGLVGSCEHVRAIVRTQLTNA
jgi:fluoroacetyl-CoA thioesterase